MTLYPLTIAYTNSSSTSAPYINSNATAYSGMNTFWVPLGFYIKNISLLLGQDNTTNCISSAILAGTTPPSQGDVSYYYIQLNGPGIYEIIINSGGIINAATKNGQSNEFESSVENTLYTVISSSTYTSNNTFSLGTTTIYDCLSTNIANSMYIMEASISGTSKINTTTLSSNKPTLLYNLYSDSNNFIPYVKSYFCGMVNSTGTYTQTTLYKYTIYNSLTPVQAIMFNIVPDSNTPNNNTVTSANIPATISVKMISKI